MKSLQNKPMPKGRKQYTKAQKRAYAKRMNNKKKGKKAVVKQNLFRTEIKSSEVVASNEDILINTATAAHGLKNNLTLTPKSLWEGHVRGAGESDVIGSYLRYAYPFKMKCQLDYSDLKYEHLKNGINLQCIKGWVKTTMNDSGVQANHANALTIIKHFTFNAGLEADFLSFAQKTNDIKIESKFRVKPPKEFNIFLQVHTSITPAGSEPKFIKPPLQNMSFKWRNPQSKQKLIATGTGSGATATFAPGDIWVPFVVFTCDQLTSSTGTISIGHCDKVYYTDQ